MCEGGATGAAGEVRRMKSRHEKKSGGSTRAMAKDPVCGMDVDPKKAVSSTIEGKERYFCSSDCRDKYAQRQGQERTSSSESREHSRA
jgi:YHS domain-containing protein